jgi:hypothetical protein
MTYTVDKIVPYRKRWKEHVGKADEVRWSKITTTKNTKMWTER